MTGNRRRVLGFAGVTAAVVAALAVIAACTPPSGMSHGPGPARVAGMSAGSGSTGAGGPADAGSQGGGGLTTFRVECADSHVLADDPIVHPNMPGMSHLHEFFGNATTNARSTAASLLGQATTCSASADASGYWVPMLYQGGVALPARSTLVYYRGGSHRVPSQVQAFPAGLRMIAGNAMATTPLPVAAVSWSCTGMTTTAAAPPTCPAGHMLTAQIRFPDCWDGRHLDSADHKSHMAYTVNGLCPSNYPAQVPELELHATYPTAGGPSTVLSSGAPFTYHADFFNAWNQSALVGFVNFCLHRGVVCGTVH